jgi:hypothetical protein
MICEALHKGVPVLKNTSSALAIFGESPFPKNVMIADNNSTLVEILERLCFSKRIVQAELFSAATRQGGFRNFY